MPKSRGRGRGRGAGTPRASTRPATRAASRAASSPSPASTRGARATRGARSTPRATRGATQRVVSTEDGAQGQSSPVGDAGLPPLSLDQMLEHIRTEVRAELQAQRPAHATPGMPAHQPTVLQAGTLPPGTY